MIDRYTLVLESSCDTPLMKKESSGDYVKWEDVEKSFNRIRELLDNCKVSCIYKCFNYEESNGLIDNFIGEDIGEFEESS